MNILFTSAGRRSYLIKYFKEAVGDSGTIHAANSSPISPAFVFADRSAVTPLIYSDEYIPFLIDYCSKSSINALIPLFDVDLPVLSAAKEKFSSIGTTVIVSDAETVDICNDKWKTHRFLTENNFHSPATFLSIDDAEAALESDSVRFPLIVKPRWGMGSIGVYSADNEAELRVFYEKVKREIFSTYLKYESAGNKDKCVLIEEKLNGQEYGVDVINDLEGNNRSVIVKRKIAMRSGETDCAITVDESGISDVGRRLGDALRHIGNLDVDMFAADGKIYVLEMNARFGGGYPFSHMAGANLPLAIVKWLNGKWADSEDSEILTAKSGVMSQKNIDIVKLNCAR